MANQSIKSAFERMWQHIVAKLGEKANAEHDHDDMYYTETEVDELVDTKIAAIPSDVFVVNFTLDDDEENVVSADKTFNDILNAHNSNKYIYGTDGIHNYHFRTIADDDCALFYMHMYSEGRAFACIVSVMSDNTIENNIDGADLFSYNYFSLKTTNKTIIGAINELNNTKLTSPTTAEVGQVIAVKAVDENGKPTEWECVNVSCGGKSYLVDWSNGYAVNEEVYNEFITYFNDPTIGFPDVSILTTTGDYSKVLSAYLVNAKGGNYSSLNGVRCNVCCTPGSIISMVIAPTSEDANSIEIQDMA